MCRSWLSSTRVTRGRVNCGGAYPAPCLLKSIETFRRHDNVINMYGLAKKGVFVKGWGDGSLTVAERAGLDKCYKHVRLGKKGKGVIGAFEASSERVHRAEVAPLPPPRAAAPAAASALLRRLVATVGFDLRVCVWMVFVRDTNRLANTTRWKITLELLIPTPSLTQPTLKSLSLESAGTVATSGRQLLKRIHEHVSPRIIADYGNSEIFKHIYLRYPRLYHIICLPFG
eukprot:1392832-Amorphochlora_amoeboformis.AAC.2